jgi:hypothetical protein
MGQNNIEAGGSGANSNCPRNLTIEETAMFAENDIFVPIDWHLLEYQPRRARHPTFAARREA